MGKTTAAEGFRENVVVFDLLSVCMTKKLYCCRIEGLRFELEDDVSM